MPTPKVFLFCIFQQNKGKIAVLGSVHIFNDTYVEKEENSKILDVIINFLTTDEVSLNQIDAEDPEVKKKHICCKLEHLPVLVGASGMF